MDRRFTPVVSGYLLAGAQTDHVKSVEVRGTGEAGAGIFWWDEKQPDGRLHLAAHGPGLPLLPRDALPVLPHADWTCRTWTWAAPAWAWPFSYGLSKDTVFTEEAEAIPNVLGDARVLVNSTSTLTVGLTDSARHRHQLRRSSTTARRRRARCSTDTALSANCRSRF